MILRSVLIPLLIFQGIVEVKLFSVENDEEINVDLNYLDISISRTAFYFQRTTDKLLKDYKLTLYKRMEDLSASDLEAISVNEYSCKLTDHEESRTPSYQLVMKKVLMPGGKRYTQLVLKFKTGKGANVNLPLATYSDHEYYPLQDPIVENEYRHVIASDTRLYLKKGSTPTSLTLLVYGLSTKPYVNYKVEADKDVYHTITFKRDDDAATITFKSTSVQRKESEKSAVNRYVKTGEYQRLEAVCKEKMAINLEL